MGEVALTTGCVFSMLTCTMEKNVYHYLSPGHLPSSSVFLFDSILTFFFLFKPNHVHVYNVNTFEKWLQIWFKKEPDMAYCFSWTGMQKKCQSHWASLRLSDFWTSHSDRIPPSTVHSQVNYFSQATTLSIILWLCHLIYKIHIISSG